MSSKEIKLEQLQVNEHTYYRVTGDSDRIAHDLESAIFKANYFANMHREGRPQSDFTPELVASFLQAIAIIEDHWQTVKVIYK